MRFLAQSYYISLYLDCPEGMGLRCPDARRQDDLRKAIKEGKILYHAYPHNGELEVGSPDVILEGIKMTHALDDSLGVPRKKTLSQRDVPGMSSAVIPLLRSQNVTAVSVGVNEASMPPQVPRVFRWVEPHSQEEVYAMWHPYGYGGFKQADAVIVPGLEHALVTIWNSDDQGPKSRLATEEDMRQIQKEYPGANVFASSFDNFTQYLDGVKDSLPVVSQEIGDTWVYGIASDPKKLAQMRGMERAWERYNREDGARSPAYLNASRLFVKGIEHTWGVDVKKFLQDDFNWANDAFNKARESSVFKDEYEYLESSWWEQRDWAVTFPASAAPEPLKTYIQDELEGVVPTKPDLSNFVKILPSSTVKVGPNEIRFTPTAAVSHLLLNNKTYATPTNLLFSLNYTTYSLADYEDFWAKYCSMDPCPSYFPKDFGKPGIRHHAVSMREPGVLRNLWLNQGEGVVIVEGYFGGNVTKDYGAPEEFYIIANLSEPGAVHVSVECYNKTATRLPESLFLTFDPPGPSTQWTLNKLTTPYPVTPTMVVPGGSQNLHSISTHVSAGDLAIAPLDSPLVALGEPWGFPITPGKPKYSPPDMSYGASSVLWNNLWGTNYIMWYPFNRDGAPVMGEGDLKFRFVVRG
eukprot:TRINITY_DN631_c0_g1_i1.p1 TRINITY_DN631_c0_g1~~TRINITY_DN631_c0_g1_i1.p1  ORF type:complete len:717 (+),score=259.27 TRINITY_DN631_c0_g1_i1:248-2152(+)